MSWAAFAPLAVAALAVLVLPGAVVAWLLGLRIRDAIVAGAPLSVLGYASLGLLYGALHIRYGLASVGLAVCAAIVVLGALRTVLRKRWPLAVPSLRRVWADRRRGWVEALAALLGVMLVVRLFALIMHRPDEFAQTYDNTFHMNCIRWVAESGDGSSLHLGPVSTGFYPAGWHDTGALIMLLTHASVPAVSNALTIAAGLVWLAGSLQLTRVLFPHNRAAYVVAAVLLTTFPMYPFRFLFRWGMMPNFFGFALMPGALALIAGALGLGAGWRGSRHVAFGIGVAVLGGVALAHPNAAMTLVALAWPGLLAWAWFGGRRGPRPGVRMLAVVLAAAATFAVWWKLRPPAEASAQWVSFESKTAALRDVLELAPRDAFGDTRFAHPSYALAVLALVGLVAALRRPRLRWLAGSWLVGGSLWVVAAGWGQGRLRTFVVGPWYCDTSRVAAVLALAAFPLVVLGAATLAHLARRLLPSPAALLATLVAGLLVAAAAFAEPAVRAAVGATRDTYDPTSWSAPWTPDKLALISRLPAIVPADQTLAVEMPNGGSMIYALTGVHVTRFHDHQVTSADQVYLEGHLNRVATDPAVCAAAVRLKVHYAVDLGDRTVFQDGNRYEGFRGLATVPGVRVVDRAGQLAVVHLDACWPGER